MLDSQIQTLIQSQLLAGLAARSVTGVSVKQDNQPRQTVAPSDPTIFHSIATPRKRYGWPSRSDTFNQTTGKFDSTTTQIMHTRFRVAAIVPVSPATPTQLTSGDLSVIASDILQHEFTLAVFIAAGCNVLRVQDLPSIWFQDSNAQNVLWASFDIIFTHKDVQVFSVDKIDNFNGNVVHVQ